MYIIKYSHFVFPGLIIMYDEGEVDKLELSFELVATCFLYPISKFIITRKLT